jgi:hypothetical protein
MEGVSWYFAKQTYLLKQIEAHRAVLDPVLYNFLMLSPADLPVARAERVRELQSLGKLTNPSAEQALRADQLRLEIRHLAFVRHLQKVVAQMDKDNSPRLVKSLLWLLIGQLSRRDISDPYADSILTLISLIDPDNRMAVQMTAVRDGQVKTLYLNMPLVLKNSAVHLEMFMRNFPLLYDQKGRPIVAPERNHIVSALQAA